MDLNDLTGPSDAELRAIELEWPLIAAEMDIVYAEALVVRRRVPSELDLRRLRHARNERLRVLAELWNQTQAVLRTIEARPAELRLAVA